jgi:hypothetical protein
MPKKRGETPQHYQYLQITSKKELQSHCNKTLQKNALLLEHTCLSCNLNRAADLFYDYLTIQFHTGKWRQGDEKK